MPSDTGWSRYEAVLVKTVGVTGWTPRRCHLEAGLRGEQASFEVGADPAGGKDYLVAGLLGKCAAETCCSIVNAEFCERPLGSITARIFSSLTCRRVGTSIGSLVGEFRSSGVLIFSLGFSDQGNAECRRSQEMLWTLEVDHAGEIFA